MIYLKQLTSGKIFSSADTRLVDIPSCVICDENGAMENDTLFVSYGVKCVYHRAARYNPTQDITPPEHTISQSWHDGLAKETRLMYTPGEWIVRPKSCGPLTLFRTAAEAAIFMAMNATGGDYYTMYHCVYLPTQDSEVWYGSVEEEDYADGMGSLLIKRSPAMKLVHLPVGTVLADRLALV